MNDLESQVLRLIGENTDSPDVFTDTSEGMEPIRDSLNDAIGEMCMVTGSYRRKYLLALLEERPIYRLGPVVDEIGCVLQVWDRDHHRPLRQTDLLALSREDPWFLKRNGNPEWWYPASWKYFGVYPRPGSKGAVLELDCLCLPAAYKHDQTPIRLREQWRQGAVFRAVSDFYASRGDAGRGTEYFNRYLEIAGLLALAPQQNERVWQLKGKEQAA